MHRLSFSDLCTYFVSRSVNHIYNNIHIRSLDIAKEGGGEGGGGFVAGQHLLDVVCFLLLTHLSHFTAHAIA